jgi:hypothetical protein
MFSDEIDRHEIPEFGRAIFDRDELRVGILEAGNDLVDVLLEDLYHSPGQRDSPIGAQFEGGNDVESRFEVEWFSFDEGDLLYRDRGLSDRVNLVLGDRVREGEGHQLGEHLSLDLLGVSLTKDTARDATRTKTGDLGVSGIGLVSLFVLRPDGVGADLDGQFFPGGGDVDHRNFEFQSIFAFLLNSLQPRADQRKMRGFLGCQEIAKRPLSSIGAFGGIGRARRRKPLNHPLAGR